MNDLKFAIRQLLKNPGFTAVAVLTLALGIGANTAIFSVLNATLLRPLPYKDPEQLVWVFAKARRMGYERLPPNWANELFSEIMARSQSFQEWARLKGKGFILQKAEGAEHIRGMRVSAHLFDLVGVQPVLGRTFLPEENELGRHRVVLLSHECWQRRFGGDPAVLSKTIQLIDIEVSDRTGQPHDTLDPQNYTIIGVLPPRWQFPMGATPEAASFFSTGAEIWEPESLTSDEKQRRAVLDLIIGRLRPRATLEQAKAETALLLENLRQESDSIDGFELLPLPRQVAGNARRFLPLLLGATGLVLLLACVNVANLLLARAAARQKEFAIRAALGAGQGRVIRQLLTESLVLAFIGGGGGLLLASKRWAFRCCVGAILPHRISPRTPPGRRLSARVLPEGFFPMETPWASASLAESAARARSLAW
jgi:putative ABC transport system permease protein